MDPLITSRSARSCEHGMLGMSLIGTCLVRLHGQLPLTAIWADATMRAAFLLRSTLSPHSAVKCPVFSARFVGKTLKQDVHVLLLALCGTAQLGHGLIFGFVMVIN